MPTNKIQDLITAINSQKSATIQATFESIMADKVRAAIDSRRQSVISQTFNQGK